MEPGDYLRLFRQRWWILASVAFVGAAFAVATSPAEVAPKVERYRAVHTLIVEPEARAWTPENPSTIALLATSGEVPLRVARRLGTPEDEAHRLTRQMTITGDSTLSVIEIKATTARRERAQQLADAFAEELVTYLDEQEGAARGRQIESARTQSADLERQIQELSARIDRGEDPTLLAERRLILVARYGDAEQRYQALIAEPAANAGLRSLGDARAVEIDAGIQAPRGRTERAAILGTIGLLLAMAVVIVLERLDVRLKTKEDAEAAFRLPVIAEIPQLAMSRRRQHDVMSHLEPASSIAEAYRGLRTTLLILKPTPLAASLPGSLELPRGRRVTDGIAVDDLEEPTQPRVFLVTSTRPSEGKTTTIVNLAAAFAEAGRSVLVVAADVRRPEVHEYLHAPRSPGLTDVLSGHGSIEDAIVTTSIPGVRLLPSGGHVSNPGELLLQGPELIAAVRPMADVILVDTTPMLTVNDAIQLMPEADSVIVTCRAGRATREAARRCQEILARLHVPVAGVVLVGARETPGVASYYYGYQSSSGSLLSGLRQRARRRPGREADLPPVAPPVARRRDVPRAVEFGPPAEPLASQSTDPDPWTTPSRPAAVEDTSVPVDPVDPVDTNGARNGSANGKHVMPPEQEQRVPRADEAGSWDWP